MGCVDRLLEILAAYPLPSGTFVGFHRYKIGNCPMFWSPTPKSRTVPYKDPFEANNLELFSR